MAPSVPSPRAARGAPPECAAQALSHPDVGRWSDNELILFWEERRESWIVYPPRSAYTFLRRPSPDATIVEFHPWEPLVEPLQHAVRPRDGCTEHGLDCRASTAIQAAVDLGYDPFR